MLCLANCAPDTGNLGVSALAYAAVHALAERLPHAEFAILDFGRGKRRWESGIPAVGERAWRYGARYSRKYYARDHWQMIRLCARLGLPCNPAAALLRSATAMLDISAGDSFADIYGARRFRSIMLPKLAALENGIPLILLPQTYGPFAARSNRDAAARVLQRSNIAWARDAHSFEIMRDLLGNRFDPARHREGVDVAFLLQATEPSRERSEVAALATWLQEGAGRGPLVGVNISGLIWNDETRSRERFGLKASYRTAVLTLLRRLLAESDARVALIPHVVTPRGHYEADLDACEAASHELASERIVVAPAFSDPREVKWLIAQCDWFCGTRMHATIAALSSGVPAAAIAYSDKTLGVFETCGQGEHVADPRQLDTGELLEHLWQSWLGRDRARQILARRLPDVLAQAGAQMDAIAAACLGNHERQGEKAVA